MCGAIHLDFKRLRAARSRAGMIPDDDFSDLFSSLGLTRIPCGGLRRRRRLAGRLLWTLDAIGHKHYSYLRVFMHGWRRDPHIVRLPSRCQRDCEVGEHHPLTEVHLDYLLEHHTLALLALWDSRSEEYVQGYALADRPHSRRHSLRMDRRHGPQQQPPPATVG